jgi:hypothetical protein
MDPVARVQDELEHDQKTGRTPEMPVTSSPGNEFRTGSQRTSGLGHAQRKQLAKP